MSVLSPAWERLHPLRRGLVFTVAMLGLTARGGAAAAQSAVPLEAGFARADITPDPGMLNWTLAAPKPYAEVHDPLFVRALVLSDGATRIAILGWDLLDAREFAVGRIRSAVAQATGIPAEHILIQATHNHSGPKSEMGPEANLQREARTSRPVQREPIYRAWADRLVATCVETVRRADAARQPVTLGLARAYVGEWLFNRRPIKSDQSVLSMLAPPDPHVLGGGLRFGTVDPIMTVLSLRAADGWNVCTLFHVPIHAVAVYGTYKGLSADWPGRVTELLQERSGRPAMFLQGCAGDIVPARRGFAAVEEMATGIVGRAVAADRLSHPLPAGALRVARTVVGLRATEAAARDLGRPDIAAEIMVVSMGPLALVTLPGEPLQDLSTAILQQTPFAHTIVLGYANGRGVGYVGLPGGKARGGYEMSEVGAGTDEAGGTLVEAALRLLHELARPAAPK